MPSTVQQDRKFASRLSSLTKEDMLVMDAEAYIRKTSLRQTERRTEHDWILYPENPKKPLARSTVVSDDVRSKSRVPIPKSSPRTLRRVPEKLEMASEYVLERKCKPNIEFGRPSSKVDAFDLTPQWIPPPAPSPPRLLTPELEDIPESAFWSCCEFHDDEHRKDFRENKQKGC